jgi:hypothetical protein
MTLLRVERSVAASLARCPKADRKKNSSIRGLQ